MGRHFARPPTAGTRARNRSTPWVSIQAAYSRYTGSMEIRSRDGQLVAQLPVVLDLDKLRTEQMAGGTCYLVRGFELG